MYALAQITMSQRSGQGDAMARGALFLRWRHHVHVRQLVERKPQLLDAFGVNSVVVGQKDQGSFRHVRLWIRGK
jgi:hypothetical protein